MSLRNFLIIPFSVCALSIAAIADNSQPAAGETLAFASVQASSSTPSASAPVSDQGAYFAPFMRFDADAGNLDVTFGIDQAARITLHAYDTQGKLLAILLDGNQVAGFHHLSLFSNHLQGYQGRVMFQLRAGQSVLAESRLQAR
jgi:hypothetical protein